MNAYQKKLTDNEFEEILNDLYSDEVNVCGYKYQQGSLLKRIDQVAFEQEKIAYECDLPWICEECENEYDSEEEAQNCCSCECFKCGSRYDNEEESFDCCPNELIDRIDDKENINNY